MSDFTIDHIDCGGGIAFEMKVKNPLTEQAEVISRWRVEIEEKAIHDALVRRGWTPPTT